MVDVAYPSVRVFEVDGYRHEPPVATVITRGESAPITPELIAQLWAIDPTTLSTDQAIGYAVAFKRIANAADARSALGVNQAVATTPDTKEIPRELAAAGQLGAALGLGSGATDTLIADAGQIATMLPGTQAAALAGDLTWRKAASIASNTAGMTPRQALRVEAKVLAKARERSPAQHDAAVRRAVDQVDPEHADRKRKDREHAIRLVRHHYGAGMGELFACMPSEDLDLVWAAADTWARRMKAAGDPRTLDVLRAAFLPQCARSFLSHGDPAYCDTVCTPLPDLPPSDLTDPDDPGAWPEPPPDDPRPHAGDGAGGAAADEPTADNTPSPPTRHGRPVVLHVVWDLSSFVGLTSHCGLLRDSGTMLPPSAMRDLLRGGGRIRRMVIAPDTGEQLDLTPVTWELQPTGGRAHRQPVVLTLTTTGRLDVLPDELRAAVEADPMLREMLDYPLTADDLDEQPDDETPSPALAEFTASRAGHPVNPCAGPTAASAGDLDHHEARSQGGKTVRINLGPFVRRWHRLKTFAGWTVKQTKRHWIWTSPTGRTYRIEPHDYRLGP